VAALHACRLIGLFTRLTVRDGKPRYAGYIPRMWGYLARDLKAPGMEPLAAWFDRYVPLEVRA
jgi:aminoglycoside/choline kinase family phosphotransferase